MYEWQKQIQSIVDEIDQSIILHRDDALTLQMLSKRLGYSEYYVTRKFREVSGMQLRSYLRCRKLAFALIEVRDSDRDLLDIAFDYGYSSHEAFTRAFKNLYGVSPSANRKNPHPLVLRTKIQPLDPYIFGLGEIGMLKSTEDVKMYFVTIPAHKFLHIRNYESIGYWDFWQKQSQIPGQDCETICGLLDSVKNKLDDEGGSEANSSSGHVMAYIFDPKGRVCEWGIPLCECYGARLAENWQGAVPPQMLLTDIPEGEYLVFEHGPFDYEQENRSGEEKQDQAMASFDFEGSGYCYDNSPGRIFYFYHDPKRFWKYIRPVKKLS